MANNNPELINKQIDSIQNEILFVKFIFTLVNSLSLFFLGFVFDQMVSNNNATNETFSGILQAAAALFAPYLSIVAQGFYFPKMRKLNAFRELVWKPSLDDCEVEIMYDK